MAGKNSSSSKTTFDPDIKRRLLQVFDRGSQLSRVPYEAYEGATVAPLSPAQLEGMQATADAARGGIGQDQLTAATEAAGRAAGFTPSFFDVNLGTDIPTVGSEDIRSVSLDAVGAVPTSTIGSTDVTANVIGPLGLISPERVAEAQAVRTNQIGVGPIEAQQVQGRTVGAESLAQTDLSPYQNQYQSDVIDAALADVERNRLMALNRNKADATRQGAAFGDRDELYRATTNQNFDREALRTAGQLRAQGYESAARRAEADVGRAQTAGFQTAQLGQQADLANQGAGLQAGTTSAQLGLQGQIETGRQSLQSGLAAQTANTQRSLANQQAGLTAGDRNLQAELARQQANQQAALTADIGSAERAQQAELDTARLAQESGLSAQELNARLGLANQSQIMDARQSNAQRSFDAARSNQQAMLEAETQRRALESQLALGREQQQLDAVGMNLRGATTLGALGDQARDFAFQDAAALEGVGDRQRGYAQELLEDRYRRFLEERDAPLRAFDIMRAGAGLLPSPVMQSSRSKGFQLL